MRSDHRHTIPALPAIKLKAPETAVFGTSRGHTLGTALCKGQRKTSGFLRFSTDLCLTPGTRAQTPP